MFPLLLIHSAESVKTAEVLTFEPTLDGRVAGEYNPVSIDMRTDIFKVNDLRRQIAGLVNAYSEDAFH
jgi:hypothetical protein